MSPGSTRCVVTLSALPRSTSIPGDVVHCATVSEATVLLDHCTPNALIIDASDASHRALAERVRASGSAVLAVGPPPPSSFAVDEWVSSDAAATELRTRLTLACARARERRRLSRRSCTDVLTGLPNRRGLICSAVHLAARAHRSSRQMSLVLFDLDGFKQINDTWGHPEGDRILRRVGAIMKSEVRHDEACGRVGGDEFAVFIAGGAAEVHRAKDRLLTALRSAGIKATAGLATSTTPRRLRQLVSDADRALLEAKRQRARTGAPRVSSRKKEVESNTNERFAYT